MPDELLALEGNVVEIEDLSISKAKATATFLKSGVHGYAHLIETRILESGTEMVVVDLDVEVGQKPVHGIRPVERLSLCFSSTDESHPEVLSLRCNFPRVPHLNAREQELPRSLCLYDQPYQDLKLTWTPARFVERIREWLKETAKGTLHHDDQPLEPILLPGPQHIVLPADLFATPDTDSVEPLFVTRANSGGQGIVLLADRPRNEQQGVPEHVATAFTAAPQVHGVIHSLPTTLGELAELAKAADLDLVTLLRDRLKGFEASATADAELILLINFPKLRNSQQPSHATPDVWAFMIRAKVADVGIALGVWQRTDSVLGRVLNGECDEEGLSALPVSVLNPLFALDRERAASLNSTRPTSQRIAAVGVGALGSQVVAKLVRSGFGTWTLIDDDRLLPHNVVRHELPHCVVGFSKAQTLALFLSDVLPINGLKGAIPANVLSPGEHEEQLQEAFNSADVIADFSASVAVSRHLARDLAAPARRLAGFLSPSGKDFVLLVEDSDRTTTLDSLEMQYYRAVATGKELAGHLATLPGSRQRHGNSCRDLTSRISEDDVAVHAAICSRWIRRALDVTSATLRIWRSDDDSNIKGLRIEAKPTLHFNAGDWTVCTDEGLLETLSALRAGQFPNETGGVLVGTFDVERRVVYVAHAIPSPSDSTEWPFLYIRGAEGLQDEVHRMGEASAGMLIYVGEWHSHPDGSGVAPSEADKKLFNWLEEHMAVEGFPPTMLIVGEGMSRSWHVGSIV